MPLRENANSKLQILCTISIILAAGLYCADYCYKSPVLSEFARNVCKGSIQIVDDFKEFKKDCLDKPAA